MKKVNIYAILKNIGLFIGLLIFFHSAVNTYFAYVGILLSTINMLFYDAILLITQNPIVFTFSILSILSDFGFFFYLFFLLFSMVKGYISFVFDGLKLIISNVQIKNIIENSDTIEYEREPNDNIILSDQKISEFYTKYSPFIFLIIYDIFFFPLTLIDISFNPIIYFIFQIILFYFKSPLVFKFIT